MKKIKTVALTLLALFGAVQISYYVYEKINRWVPQSGDTFFISGKDEKQPLVILNDKGLLTINIPLLYDTWKMDVKNKAKQPAKQTKP